MFEMPLLPAHVNYFLSVINQSIDKTIKWPKWNTTGAGKNKFRLEVNVKSMSAETGAT